LLVLILAVFIGNFVLGTRRNKELAIEWLKSVRGPISDQFSRVDTLTRVAPQTFRLNCTGRVNCFAAEFTLNLRPRQDLVSVVQAFFMSSPETVLIEVSICLLCCFSLSDLFQVPLSDKLEPFVLALFPPRKEKRMRDELPDLALAKPRESPVTGLVYLADASELLQKVRTTNKQKKKKEPCFEQVV
jgi:hypothetical protein